MFKTLRFQLTAWYLAFFLGSFLIFSFLLYAALAGALEFARRQGATLFELRCLLDSFDLLGDGDRSGLADAARRFPGDARWPEFARAQEILS